MTWFLENTGIASCPHCGSLARLAGLTCVIGVCGIKIQSAGGKSLFFRLLRREFVFFVGFKKNKKIMTSK